MKKPKKKKVSTILSVDLLNEAITLAQMNQTDTLTEALKEFIRSCKRRTLVDLKGKIKIVFDVDRDRQRSRF